MRGTLFQQWTTVQAASNLLVFTQSVEDWLDVSSFADACFWIDVSQITGSSNAVVQPVLQSSPTLDDTYFFPVAPPVTLSAGSTPILVKTVRATSTVPLARYLRWQLQVSNSSGTWGATFRVRAGLSKQSFFVPTQLPGCELWLRADMGITFGNAPTNTLVSGWADQSGNNNNASQVNSGNQPTYVTNAMNGAPALSGSGMAEWMETSAFTLGANATLFVATQPSTSTQVTYARIIEQQYSATYFLGCDTTGTHYKLIVCNNSQPYGAAQGGTVTASTNTIVSGMYSSTTGTGGVYVNGLLVGSDTFTAPSPTSLPLMIMQAFGTGGSFWAGLFAETVIYNRALSTSEMTRVHRYLGARYGVAVP
jgi:hypothetical protein